MADLVVIPCRPQILVDLETIAVTQRALAVVDSPPPVVVVLVAVPPRGQRAVQARSALQALGRFSVAGGPAQAEYERRRAAFLGWDRREGAARIAADGPWRG